MGNVYNRVRNAHVSKGETATELDVKSNIELQEDLEQGELLLQCSSHHRPVESFCMNIGCPHDKCICSLCLPDHSKCSTYIMPIKKFQPIYFERRSRLERTKYRVLHEIYEHIQELKTLCPEFEYEIETYQRIMIYTLSYCDNYASAANKIIRNNMDEATKKEIARFVLTGAEDIAKMQYKKITELLKSRVNVNARDHLMTLTDHKIELQQPYTINYTKFNRIVDILRDLKETPSSMKIVCTDTNNLDLESLAYAFKLNSMRNLGYLRLYTRWYLEDTEIYRSLVSAWENNTMLRRVDIYTTLPIVNARNFNGVSKKVNFYCYYWHE